VNNGIQEFTNRFLHIEENVGKEEREQGGQDMVDHRIFWKSKHFIANFVESSDVRVNPLGFMRKLLNQDRFQLIGIIGNDDIYASANPPVKFRNFKM
jgi:hypothetical protein